MGNREVNVAKTENVEWANIPWVSPMAMDVAPLRGWASVVNSLCSLEFRGISHENKGTNDISGEEFPTKPKDWGNL